MDKNLTCNIPLYKNCMLAEFTRMSQIYNLNNFFFYYVHSNLQGPTKFCIFPLLMTFEGFIGFIFQNLKLKFCDFQTWKKCIEKENDLKLSI